MRIEELFCSTKDFEVQPKNISEGVFGQVYVFKNIKDLKQYTSKIIKKFYAIFFIKHKYIINY